MSNHRFAIITKRPHFYLAFAFALASWLCGVSAAHGEQQLNNKRTSATDGISSQEFSRIIRDFSEAGGDFFSDNFVSNETSYLHVVDKLRQLGATGGAYIGVGPEQNFTYIAKVRPQIAFIVDIRRQAIIQHLMYKAVFHLSPTPADFLSLLYSKPLNPETFPSHDATFDRLVAYFTETPSNDETFKQNLASIRRAIEDDFDFPLSEADRKSLEYVYSAFQKGNLDVSFRVGSGYGGDRYGGYPSMREILLEKDLTGNFGNFLATAADYDFVRSLQEKNRIIPVVGNFGGSKAFTAVADYLKENGYTVSAFYTSNVEQYLFGDRIFDAFVQNVKKMPIGDNSVFIRAARTFWQGHPASVSGHRMTTMLEKMNVFLQDCDEGLYSDYWTLLTTHFITGKEEIKPQPEIIPPGGHP